MQIFSHWNNFWEVIYVERHSLFINDNIASLNVSVNFFIRSPQGSPPVGKRARAALELD